MMLWRYFLLLVPVFAIGLIEADDKNFEKYVNRPGVFSFVKFYASWCGHCKNLQPVWEELAEGYAKHDNIQFVSIDADKYSKIGRKYSIQGYPTLKVFSDNGMSDYQGGRSLEDLEKFVEITTGVKSFNQYAGSTDHTKYLDDSSISEALDGKHGFIAVTASWCGYCKKLKPAWTKLAYVFHNDDDVVIADVVASEVGAEDIKSKFDVKSFPTVAYIAPDDPSMEHPQFYNGDRSLPDLLRWVNSFTKIYREDDGTLGPLAGLLPEVDSQVSELLVLQGADQSQKVDDLIKLVENTNGTEYSSKYYIKLFNKLKAGQTDFFQKEHDRLVKLSEKASNWKVKDNIITRINILKNFVGITVRDEL